MESIERVQKSAERAHQRAEAHESAGRLTSATYAEGYANGLEAALWLLGLVEVEDAS